MLYESRKQRGRETSCIQDIVDTSVGRLEVYIKRVKKN